VFLGLFVVGNPVYGLEFSTQLWESYTTNDDTDNEVYSSNWYTQTFTTTTSHTVEYVKLKLYQEGTPGILEVQIQGVDDAGKPDGMELTSGVVNGSQLAAASPGGWQRIDVDSFTLDTETQYAIVVRGTGTNAANNVHWRKDGSAGTYAGGQYGASTDSGGTWTMNADDDFMFEVWGLCRLCVEQAKVFTDYIDTGDWLFVVEYGNMFKPYYPAYNSKNYFNLQLVNDDTGDVEAQVPMAQWGVKPGSIYISVTDAESLEWQGNYSIRLNGTFVPYPNASYTLQGEDWIGSNLVLLDDWCLLLAYEIQEFYGTDPAQGECCLAASIHAGKSVLNNEGGAIFMQGIPYLDQVRRGIFAYTIQEGGEGETNYSWAYVESLDWQAAIGPEIANASTEFSYYWFSIERPTGGRIMLGSLLFVIFCIMAAVGVPIGHHTAGMVMGLPILIAGCWLNILPWAAAGAVLLILIFILVKNFWWSGT